MPKPEHMTDEQWEQDLERRATEKQREMHLERIRREGFEVSAYEVGENEVCQRATTRKIRNRWGTEPCGKPAMVSLRFSSPENPEGCRVPLCRACVGWLARDLIGYLEV